MLLWQKRSILALLVVCLGLIFVGGTLNSSFYKMYQQDLENNRRDCQAEGKAEERKNAKECQSVLYRTFDDPVALLTGGLVIATVALFVVTYLLYATAARQGADAKEASRSAALSAEAAKLSAEASVKAERAIVITTAYNVGIPSHVAHPPDNVTPPPYMLLTYRFANLGRTPAEIQSYCLEVFEGEVLPDVPIYEREYAIVPGSFIMPGDGLNMNEIFEYSVTRRARVEHEAHRLIFYGFVKWTDYLGHPHESRFCMRALPRREPPDKWFAFVLDGDTPEAYTRRT